MFERIHVSKRVSLFIGLNTGLNYWTELFQTGTCRPVTSMHGAPGFVGAPGFFCQGSLYLCVCLSVCLLSNLLITNLVA